MTARTILLDVSGYLDAASAEPLHPAARAVLAEAYDQGWADPLRLYGTARRARMLLDNAREVVAAALDARPDEVVFTSSGTTAAHLGVLGLGAAGPNITGPKVTGPDVTEGSAEGVSGRPDVVVSAVEHSAVLYAARHRTAHRGYAGHPGRTATLTEIPVDASGQVDADRFATCLTPATGLACLQAANHEVGTLQPVTAVAAATHEAGVPLLIDASQTVGRTSVPKGWDGLVADARTWGGPPGVGVLAIRRAARFRSPWPEDEHEAGRVPGPAHIPAIVAAATALRARIDEAESINTRHRELIDRIRREVPALISDVDVVGHSTARLPHIVTFSVLYLDGMSLVTALDEAGFAVSSGSSCTSNALEPSHVLVAMGALTHGNVRISLSRDTTAEDIDRLLATLPEVVNRLRREVGAL